MVNTRREEESNAAVQAKSKEFKEGFIKQIKWSNLKEIFKDRGIIKEELSDHEKFSLTVNLL